ncbi:ImuA family protein [Mesorhizobium sp. NBSH29]|uniref:ImuA family protein n=1 Tax=Mesorhizobium sp. NBSH29 TaxID=2654249 RepID=UPI002155FB6F|nr:hypothetical protein [Mesorhizobium sp. NBSH29]
MAPPAVTQEAFFALRQRIAKIEGTQPEWLPGGLADVKENDQVFDPERFLATGVASLDRALGGGLPRAALTEIHGRETRDSGAVAGFALALAGLILDPGRSQIASPVLWIGVSQAFTEMGFLHAPGISHFTGLSLDELLVAQTSKLADAMWIAEEAARLREISGIFLEIHGNPGKLDLTATRRLHRRAQRAGRPVFLLRQAAFAEPTAAPMRLIVAAAPARPRNTIAGPLDGSIGWSAFKIAIGKGHSALPGEFVVEWNNDASAFQERHPANSGALVSPPFLGPDFPATDGQVVAFEAGGNHAADHQPPGEQHPAHRQARRTG